MLSERTKKLIQLALDEDIGTGDLTTQSVVSEKIQARGSIVAKEPLILFGQEVAEAVFQTLDSSLRYKSLQSDGTAVQKNEVLATVQGAMGSVLTGERTALNFLQRLSGVATFTNMFVSEVRKQKGQIQILDTRKTTPGFRELEKAAVKAGGGMNHRIGLFDAVLIKNNHIDALQGDVKEAIHRARDRAPRGTRIQVEVRNEAELKNALAAKPDAFLLDNIVPSEISRLVRIIRDALGDKVFIEASGGVRLDTVVNYCIAGLDGVSVGALTHSAKAVDISLRVELVGE